MLLQASHERAPIYSHTLGEDQDMRQTLGVNLPGQDFAGLKGTHALLEGEAPPL
jgi:hypothetical protein